MLALKSAQWERRARDFPACVSRLCYSSGRDCPCYHSRCNDWRIPGFLWLLLEIIMDVFQDTQTVNHHTSAVQTGPTFPVIFQLFILWVFFHICTGLDAIRLSITETLTTLRPSVEILGNNAASHLLSSKAELQHKLHNNTAYLDYVR